LTFDQKVAAWGSPNGVSGLAATFAASGPYSAVGNLSPFTLSLTETNVDGTKFGESPNTITSYKELKFTSSTNVNVLDTMFNVTITNGAGLTLTQSVPLKYSGAGLQLSHLCITVDAQFRQVGGCAPGLVQTDYTKGSGSSVQVGPYFFWSLTIAYTSHHANPSLSPTLVR
jgi:hypothetical protein